MFLPSACSPIFVPAILSLLQARHHAATAAASQSTHHNPSRHPCSLFAVSHVQHSAVHSFHAHLQYSREFLVSKGIISSAVHGYASIVIDCSSPRQPSALRWFRCSLLLIQRSRAFGLPHSVFFLTHPHLQYFVATSRLRHLPFATIKLDWAGHIELGHTFDPTCPVPSLCNQSRNRAPSACPTASSPSHMPSL